MSTNISGTSEITNIINIFAIIFSPIIAIVVSEILRRRNFKKDKRLSILSDLMAFRDKLDSKEFLSALNSLKLFYNDKNLEEMVFELRKSFEPNNGDKASVLITKVIKRVCELEKFDHIAISDIENLFKAK